MATRRGRDDRAPVDQRQPHREMPFDPERERGAPDSMACEMPNVAVVASAHVPANAGREFIAFTKARPNRIAIGSSGLGTTMHLSGVLLPARTGIDGEHVTFRRAAQTIPVMLSGDVNFAVDDSRAHRGVEGGRHPRARHGLEGTLARLARGPDHGRGQRRGFRRDVVNEHYLPCQHAASNRRQDLRRAQGARSRSGVEEALPRRGRAAAAQYASGGEDFRREGNQDVAGGRAAFGPDAAVVHHPRRLIYPYTRQFPHASADTANDVVPGPSPGGR